MLETSLDIYSEEEYSLDKEMECLMKSLFLLLKRKKNIKKKIFKKLFKKFSLNLKTGVRSLKDLKRKGLS
jgi:hypothetical protein